MQIWRAKQLPKRKKGSKSEKTKPQNHGKGLFPRISAVFHCINFGVAMFSYACGYFPDRCLKFLLLKIAPKLMPKNRRSMLSVSFYAALMVMLSPKVISNSFKASFNFSFSALSSTLIVAFGIDCNKGTAIKLRYV